MLTETQNPILKEEINKTLDESDNPWGGKKMWEARLHKLDEFVNKLFLVIHLSAVISYAGLILNFIIQACITGEPTALFLVACGQIVVLSLIFILMLTITKLITHHIKSTEIYYANITTKSEKKSKTLNEGN